MFEIVHYWATCKCINVPEKLSNAFKNLSKSFIEFAVKFSCNEASDVMFHVGLLLGSIINKPYVSIPGDRLALEEMKERMMRYKCIKDTKYLINGKCPSKF